MPKKAVSDHYICVSLWATDGLAQVKGNGIIGCSLPGGARLCCILAENQCEAGGRCIFDAHFVVEWDNLDQDQ